ncbi:MAG: Ig-like domain-containing protein, partial [Desulfobacterales bacterium]|nr:Ig-like domain-containing protein [Desulfobacterales bacterium]
FSEPMISDTVTTATFSLGYGTDDVTGTVTYNGTTGTFTPAEVLAYNTNYTATITDAAKDLAGNPLENDYTWSFTTGPEPDTTPPTVSSTSPENDAESVSADSAVIVTFSEPMISDTVTTATFSLSYGTDDVTGTVTYNGTTGTFTPAEVLAYNTDYTAMITDAAKDLAGNPLENDYTWSFTTGPEPDTTPPTVSSTSPENNAVGVSVDSAIIATFSEPMKSAAITTATFYISDGAGELAGTVTYDGTTGAFNPSENLTYNTIYTAVITADANDLAGNPLENDYTWSFTTGPRPDTTPPTVSSTSPENGASDVSVDSSVIVTFSEPMKSSAITTATFSVSNGTDNIAGAVTYDGTTGAFNPSENLEYNTAYTASVTTAAKDLAGNPLENDYTWSFTTGPRPDTTPPTVSSTSPENGASDVSVDSSVIVTFSEPMKSSAITTATFSVSNGTD